MIFNNTIKLINGWAAYSTERQTILDFVHDNDIWNVIFIRGDLHVGCIDDGTNSGLAEMVIPCDDIYGCCFGKGPEILK